MYLRVLCTRRYCNKIGGLLLLGEEVMTMVTFTELIMFTSLIVAIVVACYTIFSDNKRRK